MTMTKEYSIAGLLVVTLSFGCQPDDAGGGAQTASMVLGRSGEVVLEPGRTHDVSSADLEGTVQFRVLHSPAGDPRHLLSARIRYLTTSGASVAGQIEVSPIKGTASLIVIVRAAQPLAVDAWHTLAVQTGGGLTIADTARIGADGAWTMRLYTGYNPQIVGVRTGHGHVDVEMSEPVNWKEMGLRLSAAGRPVAGCFETAAGCVDEVTTDHVDERVSFRPLAGRVEDTLDVALTGAGPISPAGSAVRFSRTSWRPRQDGTGAWLKKGVAE